MINILFVSSANQKLSPIVTSQMKSLVVSGIKANIYGIIGKGLYGYLKNIPSLRKAIHQNSPDVIHAHYSFCGIVASLSTRKPVVCSLMGSDVKSSLPWRWVIKLFSKYLWAATIVKSEDMKQSMGLEDVQVIPNGVDIQKFLPMAKVDCRMRLGWDGDKKIVLFAANPERYEKNYVLAKAATDLMDDSNVELKVVHSISHDDVPLNLNAADVILLTSLWEGSPNIVKEAMACNTPVVSTDVGDVKWLLDGVEGSFVTTDKAADVCEKISNAIAYTGSYCARDRLIELKLDSSSVAHKLIHLYERIID